MYLWNLEEKLWLFLVLKNQSSWCWSSFFFFNHWQPAGLYYCALATSTIPGHLLRKIIIVRISVCQHIYPVVMGRFLKLYFIACVKEHSFVSLTFPLYIRVLWSASVEIITYVLSLFVWTEVRKQKMLLLLLLFTVDKLFILRGKGIIVSVMQLLSKLLYKVFICSLRAL